MDHLLPPHPRVIAGAVLGAAFAQYGESNEAEEYARDRCDRIARVIAEYLDYNPDQYAREVAQALRDEYAREVARSLTPRVHKQAKAGDYEALRNFVGAYSSWWAMYDEVAYLLEQCHACGIKQAEHLASELEYAESYIVSELREHSRVIVEA